MARIDAIPELNLGVPVPGRWTRQQMEAFATRLEVISGRISVEPQEGNEGKGKILPPPLPGRWTAEHRDRFADRMTHIQRKTQEGIKMW